MFTESSVVMYDNIIIDFQKGTPVSVEFDFMKIWEFRKLLGDQFNPEKLHFYHVHPLGFRTQMSSVDENCLIGLSLAFNYSVNFSIIVFNTNRLYDYSRNVYCWDKENNTFLYADRHLILGRMILSLLRNLSVGE
jgi:hypothetical protein